MALLPLYVFAHFSMSGSFQLFDWIRQAGDRQIGRALLSVIGRHVAENELERRLLANLDLVCNGFCNAALRHEGALERAAGKRYIGCAALDHACSGLVDGVRYADRRDGDIIALAAALALAHVFCLSFMLF